MWNSKLVTKHLTKPDNFHEPCVTSPSSPSAKICTREAPKVPLHLTPTDPVLNCILKIKQYFQYTWNSNLPLLLFYVSASFYCHSAHQCQVNMLPLGTSTQVNPGQPSDTCLLFLTSEDGNQSMWWAVCTGHGGMWDRGADQRPVNIRLLLPGGMLKSLRKYSLAIEVTQCWGSTDRKNQLILQLKKS